jgi:hypothetical protein
MMTVSTRSSWKERKQACSQDYRNIKQRLYITCNYPVDPSVNKGKSLRFAYRLAIHGAWNEDGRVDGAREIMGVIPWKLPWN